MGILDLPTELLQLILHRAILARGIKRGLRLRLVNKIFAAEVVEILFAYRCLDSYFCSLQPGQLHNPRPLPPFTASYLHYRIKAISRTKNLGPLINSTLNDSVLDDFRNVALKISANNTTLQHDECLRLLCAVIVNSSIGIASSPIAGLSTLFQIRRLRSDTTDGKESIRTLFAAEIITNTTMITRWFIEKSKHSIESDRFLGDPVALAARYANFDILALLICERREHGLHERRRIQLFISAAQAGRLDAVRFIYEFQNAENPWYFADRSTLYGILDPLGKALTTPSREVWDYVTSLRREYGLPYLSHSKLTQLLCTSAMNGWTDRVAHLLDLGANPNGPSYTRDEPSRGRPILDACAGGYTEVVRLLLQYNAGTSRAIPTAAAYGYTPIVRMLLNDGADPCGALLRAARGGYIEVVRLLLEAGVDVNEEDDGRRLYRVDFGRGEDWKKPRPNTPIACAIAMENVDILKLLLKGGARMDDEIWHECVDIARRDSLESMLDLFSERSAWLCGPLSSRKAACSRCFSVA